MRRRPAVLVLTAALVAAVALLPAGTASAAAPPATAPAGPVALRMDDVKVMKARVAGLDRILKTRSLTDLVTNDLTNAGATSGCSTQGVAGATARARVLCFTAADTRTLTWIPQGITGPADSAADKRWGTLPTGVPLVVSWYNTETTLDRGVRVSFLDQRTGRYRHALLVYPLSTNDFVQVRVHAGGIAWYGRYLYVADTTQGIRVFDLSTIFDLAPPGADTEAGSGATTNITDDRFIGRQVVGGSPVYYSFGYRFVIPQIATWTQVTAVRPHPKTQAGGEFNCTPTTGTHTEDAYGMRFSWLTVDRVGAAAFAAGEYCQDKNVVSGDTSADNPGRMVRWSAAAIHAATLTPPATLPVTVKPLNVVRLPSFTVQGAAHAGAYWYFNSTRSCTPAAQLYRQWSGRWTGGGTRSGGIGAEDLYRDDSGATTLVWSLTEDADSHRGCANRTAAWRAVYAQRLAP